jgi:hypothetical protein
VLARVVATRRAALAAHPIYEALRSRGGVRVFMEHHVFAVLDFMSVLKALARRLTCVEIPWRPTGDPTLRRFVHEIVLGEECDDDGAGGVASHYELYLAAMRDAGADTSAVSRFVAALDSGVAWRDALGSCGGPPAATAFTHATLESIESFTLPSLAATFCFGREEIIPEMFLAILDAKGEGATAQFARFRYYLDRHVAVDGESHGPLARRLVDSLVRGDAALGEAGRAARSALDARIALFDAIDRAIRDAR